MAKLRYFLPYGADYTPGWYVNASDFDDATTIVIPTQGSKTLDIVVPLLWT